MTAFFLSLALVAWYGQPASCEPFGADLVRSITWHESRGNPAAVSPAGAVGLMQVMPAWSKVPRWALFVPYVNRAEGCRILARWRKRAGGNLSVALAAYNGGNVGLRGRCQACQAYARGVIERRARGR